MGESLHRMSLGIAAACAIGVGVSGAHAEDAGLQEAFDALWAMAADPAAGITAAITYRTADLEVLPREEMEALRREVSRAPAHPRRLELWRYERALAGDPLPREVRVWLAPGATREVMREPIGSRGSGGPASLRYAGWGSGAALIVLILWRVWRRGSSTG